LNLFESGGACVILLTLKERGSSLSALLETVFAGKYTSSRDGEYKESPAAALYIVPRKQISGHAKLFSLARPFRAFFFLSFNIAVGRHSAWPSTGTGHYLASLFQVNKLSDPVPANPSKLRLL
jgi:hypothetical protein